jgi:hypothetical protein
VAEEHQAVVVETPPEWAELEVLIHKLVAPEQL